jgi:hypothetical protein
VRFVERGFASPRKTIGLTDTTQLGISTVYGNRRVRWSYVPQDL